MKAHYEYSMLKEDLEASVEQAAQDLDARAEVKAVIARSRKHAGCKGLRPEWNRIATLLERAGIASTANDRDRKNDWEALKIVHCMLDDVHSFVINSIEVGLGNGNDNCAGSSDTVHFLCAVPVTGGATAAVWLRGDFDRPCQ